MIGNPWNGTRKNKPVLCSPLQSLDMINIFVYIINISYCQIHENLVKVLLTNHRFQIIRLPGGSQQLEWRKEK